MIFRDVNTGHKETVWAPSKEVAYSVLQIYRRHVFNEELTIEEIKKIYVMEE